MLPASVVYHAPRDTITRGALTFLAAVVLFDAIPTGWVSNHNSVGLIPLQRWYTHAVAALRRSIPKYVVKTSAGIITASVLRRCNCAASMSPKMLQRGEKLVWRIFVVISRTFYCKIFAPIGLHKNTLPLVGWSQKYLSGNYSDFLTPTDAVTQKINTNIFALRNITNPTCRDGVKKYYSR